MSKHKAKSQELRAFLAFSPQLYALSEGFFK